MPTTAPEALGPLFAAGAQKWAEAVRDAPAELAVPEAPRHAVTGTLTPGVGVRAESLEWVRTLLRPADGSPALRRVWGEACQTAERTLADVLARRLAPTRTSAPPDGGESAVRGPSAPPGAVPGMSADLRPAAAVASAAVRVAGEAWAAGAEPPDGPTGPPALALRDLATLDDFPWSAVRG